MRIETMWKLTCECVANCVQSITNLLWSCSHWIIEIRAHSWLKLIDDKRTRDFISGTPIRCRYRKQVLNSLKNKKELASGYCVRTRPIACGCWNKAFGQPPNELRRDQWKGAKSDLLLVCQVLQWRQKPILVCAELASKYPVCRAKIRATSGIDLPFNSR